MAKNIGSQLTREDIIRAAQEIEQKSIKISSGNKYLVEVLGSLYPATDIVRIAAKIKGLNIDDFRLSGG